MEAARRMALPIIGAALAAAMPALAEHHEAAEVTPTRGFVETWTCDFVDGKTMADLEPLLQRTNQWLEGRPVNNYSMYTLVPYFFSPSIDFDVGLLGATPDAETWGKLEDDWHANGGELMAAYGRVITCASHASYTVINTKSPVDWERWDFGPTRFSDCTMAEGMRVEEAVDLIEQWGEYQAELGMKGGHWMFFPHYGEDPDADWDFKLVTTDASFAELGRRVDQYYAEGGGDAVARELAFGRIACDTPRVYTTTRYRLGIPAD